MNNQKTPYFGTTSRTFPKLVAGAINDLEGNLKVPRPLAVATVLTAISATSQGRINVHLPNGKKAPTSLFFVTVLESGAGKSAAEDIVMPPLRDFDADQRRIEEIGLINYELELTIWKKKLKSIGKEFDLAKDDTARFLAREELRRHQSIKPRKPSVARLLLDDVNIPALLKALSGKGRSLALISDEGSTALGGPLFAKPGMLAQLWGGKNLSVDRISSASFMLTDPRLTISLSLQPGAFQRFMEKRGGIARDNGLLARFLTARAQSNVGFRLETGGDTANWHGVTKFHQRLRELLHDSEQRFYEDHSEKRLLEFSPDARATWIQYANYVEVQMRPSGYYNGIQDIAARSAEQVARMAALLHYFCDVGGDINPHTVEQAIYYCDLYLMDALDLYCPPAIPEEIADAMELDRWLRDRFCNFGIFQHRKNDILRLVPGEMRSVVRFDRALDILCLAGRVKVYQRPGNRTKYVELLRASLPYAAIAQY